MIQRLNCPITGQPTEVIFSRPYTLSEFQPMMRADFWPVRRAGVSLRFAHVRSF